MANFQERITELFEREQDKNHKRTQTEFAKELGVTYNQLSSWLNGRALPRADTILKIAAKVNVSSSWLLGETDVQTPVDCMQSAEWSEIADCAAGLSPHARNVLKAFIAYLKILENEKKPPCKEP